MKPSGLATRDAPPPPPEYPTLRTQPLPEVRVSEEYLLALEHRQLRQPPRRARRQDVKVPGPVSRPVTRTDLEPVHRPLPRHLSPHAHRRGSTHTLLLLGLLLACSMGHRP